MYQISASNHDRLHATFSERRSRNRGVILSKQGWQKLVQAGVLHDQWGNRYTYETLSERSLLNDRTVSRILSCEVRVDKRSLKIFFSAFGLHLTGNDYLTAIYDSSEQALTGISHYLSSAIHSVETTLSYQELLELHQRLMQDLNHLSHLLKLHEMNESMLLRATEFN